MIYNPKPLGKLAVIPVLLEISKGYVAELKGILF